MRSFFCLFFFNDTATTEIYTLSLHDALPISALARTQHLQSVPVDLPLPGVVGRAMNTERPARLRDPNARSEEHTSELQSLTNLVCRLLLEKNNIILPGSANSNVAICVFGVSS